MGVLSILAENPVLSAVAGFFICFEGHYFWRLASTVVINGFLSPRVKPTSPIRNYSLCTTTDLDNFLHMNNARYAREMDFGRWSYYIRTGMGDIIRKGNVTILQASMLVRYRKEVSLFMPFFIETNLVFWDDLSVYFEQKLVTLHDRRARCVSYSQQRVLGQLTASELVALAFGKAVEPPTPPASLKAFIDANAAYQVDLAAVEKRN